MDGKLDFTDHTEANLLMEQSRCVCCKKKTFDQMVTCSTCQEYRYCSIQCLVRDEAEHSGICQYIGIRKGILQVLHPEVASCLAVIMSKAKVLDDAGDLKHAAVKDKAISDSSAPTKQPTESKKKKKKRSKRKGKAPGVVSSQEARLSSDDRPDSHLGMGSLKSVREAKGRYGGPTKCSDVEKSGVTFGDGWWNTRPAQRNVQENNKKAHAEGTLYGKKGNSTFAYTYDSDSESAVECQGEEAHNVEKDIRVKDVNTRKNSDKKMSPYNGPTETISSQRKGDPSCRTFEEGEISVVSGAECATGRDLEPNVGAEFELMRYDEEKARKILERRGAKLKMCHFCEKESFTMKKCGRCKRVDYCNKDCQLAHFQMHKKTCKKVKQFEDACEKLPFHFTVIHPNIELTFENGFVLESMYTKCGLVSVDPVIGKIVGPHPHPFRHGAIIEDILGKKTSVLFYSNTEIYIHHVKNIPVPVHLSDCLRQGNFMVFLEPYLHFFLDGTVGIRIDDPDTVKFIFQ